VARATARSPTPSWPQRLGGAGGGLAYALIGRPLRRVPHVGPYLAGIVAVMSYLAVILFLVAPALGEHIIEPGDRLGWVVFAVMGVLYGATIGRDLLHESGEFDDAAT
jgi:uncharacterized membrane protein YeiH